VTTPPVRIDLHTHTTASDGQLAPADLVAYARERGVGVLGITDHDTVGGIAEARTTGERLGVEVVAGVELNTDLDLAGPDGPDHADILGYLVDLADPAFARLLHDIRAARQTRARAMVDRLRALDATITYADVDALAAGGAVGRPHVARALVDSRFVPDIATAFRLYIGRGGPAYADRYRLGAADACRAVRAAGGVPVLAHPVPPANPWSDPLHLRTFLPPLVEAGLGGLECYYPGYTARVKRWLEALAWHFKLVPTGGSDFHGPWRNDREVGMVDLPADTLDRLRSAAGGT
jgi:3',5'-nucleoside bisphosphate phosphatase